MLEAAMGDGHSLDLVALGKVLGGSTEVDIGWGHVVQALVVAGMVVVADEGRDVPLELTRQIVVVEQDAVLERLVPALDLALRLRMVGRAADMAHALVVQPCGEILTAVGRAIVAEQPGQALDEAVLHRLARRDVMPLDSMVLLP